DPSDTGDAANGYPSSWHGTHVAGTVAAVTNNAKGVAGVAFNAKVVPVRVLGKQGGYTSDIADAIVWASGGSVTGVPANANPAEVINMSLGGQSTCSSTYQNAINTAVNNGTTVVVAAGNSNMDVANFTPASCNNVIAVAANDKEGNRASYSNYGAKIDVTAPGGETATTTKGVLSTLNSGTTSPSTESYAFYQGTSMAAPHVAGLVALMQSVAPSPKSPADIESLLKSTARALPGSCSGGCGAGIVDALAAVNAAKGVTPPPPSDNKLTNGVPVTNLAASTGNSLNYTMDVPAGASNLSFAMSGGTGDADLYVKFGSAPTDTSYDCRPYKSGNAETCTFATPQVGTYYVRIKAYSSFSGVSLTGSYSTTTTQPSFFENTADYTINDNATVESPISVNRTGYAPSGLKVAVNIKHTYIGDLKVDLVAPDGSVYTLHNRSGGSADNILTTYTVNASAELANGTWKLRVNDNASQDTGYIDSWSLQF
ncbi:MAG TPA: S8 family serine peptidase, partial [Vicinamibacterales bacterium]|nr:S8 family serine peptidase [Vicinamibacterales bacterium]